MLLSGKIKAEELNPQQIQMMKQVDWLQLGMSEAGGDMYQALSSKAYQIGERIKKL